MAWVYASTDGKEQVAIGSAAIVISSLAYSIFGKKALFISACALYAAFYFRKSFSNNSASLISAVISLPLCGFINPLSAIPSAIYLCYYVLKHDRDQQDHISRVQQATAQAKDSAEKEEKQVKEASQVVDILRANTKLLLETALSKPKETPPSLHYLETFRNEIKEILDILDQIINKIKSHESPP